LSATAVIIPFAPTAGVPTPGAGVGGGAGAAAAFEAVIAAMFGEPTPHPNGDAAQRLAGGAANLPMDVTLAPAPTATEAATPGVETVETVEVADPESPTEAAPATADASLALLGLPPMPIQGSATPQPPSQSEADAAAGPPAAGLPITPHTPAAPAHPPMHAATASEPAPTPDTGLEPNTAPLKTTTTTPLATPDLPITPQVRKTAQTPPALAAEPARPGPVAAGDLPIDAPPVAVAPPTVSDKAAVSTPADAPVAGAPPPAAAAQAVVAAAPPPRDKPSTAKAERSDVARDARSSTPIASAPRVGGAAPPPSPTAAMTKDAADSAPPIETAAAALHEPAADEGSAGTDGAGVANPTTSNALPSQAPAPHVVRGAPETVANLAAQILKKLDGRSTRFDIELTPLGLGRVDVRVDIGAHGRVTAAMSFDNPQAAADLKSRAGDLQRALEQAGFDLSGGITFDVAGDQGRSGHGQGGRDEPGATFRGRAFQAALDTAGNAADAAVDGALNLRRGRASGIDVRI
jgi:flagellar hook-length control protein FliK